MNKIQTEALKLLADVKANLTTIRDSVKTCFEESGVPPKSDQICTAEHRRFIAIDLPPNHPDPEGAIRAAVSAANEGILNHLDRFKRK